MSTVKFDSQDELDEMQAKIYLDTKKKLSKKEILELFFKFGKKNYEEVIKDLLIDESQLSDVEINNILDISDDWGKGTENSSITVDKTLYSKK